MSLHVILLIVSTALGCRITLPSIIHPNLARPDLVKLDLDREGALAAVGMVLMNNDLSRRNRHEAIDLGSSRGDGRVLGTRGDDGQASAYTLAEGCRSRKVRGAVDFHRA